MLRPAFHRRRRGALGLGEVRVCRSSSRQTSPLHHCIHYHSSSEEQQQSTLTKHPRASFGAYISAKNMSTDNHNNPNHVNPDVQPSASPSPALIVLDGSYGEGGGQILRNSMSYAALLGLTLCIEKIRAGRSQPGLKAQHVASVELPAKLAAVNNDDDNADCLRGCVLGSSCITYTPPPPAANDNNVNQVCTQQQERHVTQTIGTAGSICLLLQSSLPVALFSPAPAVRLTLGGGTNATMAPQYDYWAQVFLPTLQRHCGLSTEAISAHVVRRGYFPKGGGQVDVHVQHPLTTQQTLQPIQLTNRGDEIVHLRVRAYYTGAWKRHQAEEMVDAAQSFLQQHGLWPNDETDKVTVDIVAERRAVGSGMGILLVAETNQGCLLAGSALCDRKVKGVAAGTAAANELLHTWLDGGAVDEWLQDQLVLYMALAAGTSRVVTGSLTLHTQTAIWVAEQLTAARFVVTRLDNGEDNDKQRQDDEDATKQSDSKRPRNNTRQRPPPTADYGTHGRISGRHLIECTGIGLHGRAKGPDHNS